MAKAKKTSVKVEALDTYENFNCSDFQLSKEHGERYVPKEGEQWEVSRARLGVLLGDNVYKVAFVKVVENG